MAIFHVEKHNDIPMAEFLGANVAKHDELWQRFIEQHGDVSWLNFSGYSFVLNCRGGVILQFLEKNHPHFTSK